MVEGLGKTHSEVQALEVLANIVCGTGVSVAWEAALYDSAIVWSTLLKFFAAQFQQLSGCYEGSSVYPSRLIILTERVDSAAFASFCEQLRELNMIRLAEPLLTEILYHQVHLLVAKCKGQFQLEAFVSFRPFEFELEARVLTLIQESMK